jgi:hypothetical protein
MTIKADLGPTGSNPHEVIADTTEQWGNRLIVAQARHRRLDGELPSSLARAVITIIDGESEAPSSFSLPKLCDQAELNVASSGLFLYINYEGRIPPDNTHDLLAVIDDQRTQTDIPIGVAQVGYNETRRIDKLRSDAWDILVAHALRNTIEHPIICISNDADTTGHSADYWSCMAQNDYAERPDTVWGSKVTYSQPGGADLPLHRLVTYLNEQRNLRYELFGRPVIYGGSLGLTLETYATSGGWTGPHTEPNPYGLDEPSRLLANVWEHATKRLGRMDDLLEPYKLCARRVGGLVEVSSRREIEAYSHALGVQRYIVENITTNPDSLYRRYTADIIAELAASIAMDDSKYKVQLDLTDAIFLPEARRLGKETEMRQAQQALRERLNLPYADV